MTRKKLDCAQKETLGISVTRECIDALRKLSNKHRVSMATVAEYAFRIELKSLPDDIKSQVAGLPRA